jgi:hypothetical protein
VVVPVVTFVVLLAVGALTGRVKVRSCCSMAASADDLRMRAADVSNEPSTGG